MALFSSKFKRPMPFIAVLLLTALTVSCVTKEKTDMGVASDPWMRAARTADLPQLKGMYAGGKPIDAASDVGVTALIVASRMGNIETMKWLIENGANVNHRDRDGQSALVYALTGIARGVKRVQAVELLLQHGADPFIVDAVGFCPVQEMLALEMDEQLKKLSYTDKKPCDRMPKIKGEMTLSQAARKMERLDMATFFEQQGCW